MGITTFIHHFERGTEKNKLQSRPLLLLHGTGGNEKSLLWLGREVCPGASILSVRGKVTENGMPRFFRRFAENVLDEDDVRCRALDLADFVTSAGKQYGIYPPVALGYSNGANMALAVLQLRPEIFAGVILLRSAMIPISLTALPNLADKPILIISGTYDPTILADRFCNLLAQLRRCGGQVTHKIVPVGHELSEEDVALSRDWFENTKF